MDQDGNIELGKLRLEERRLDVEESLKRAEIKLRERELRSARYSLSASAATTLAALMGLVGVMIGPYITGYLNNNGALGLESTRGDNAIKLEREKFETTLILKALDAKDQKTSILTLRFIARAGLIPSYEGKILTISEDEGGTAVPYGVPSYGNLGSGILTGTGSPASFIGGFNPYGGLSNTINQSGDLSNVVRPFGGLSNVLNPSGGLSNMINPSGDLSNAVNPPGGISNVLNPSGDLSNAVNPPGGISNVLNPSGGLSNMVKPSGGLPASGSPEVQHPN